MFDNLRGESKETSLFDVDEFEIDEKEPAPKERRRRRFLLFWRTLGLHKLRLRWPIELVRNRSKRHYIVRAFVRDAEGKEYSVPVPKFFENHNLGAERQIRNTRTRPGIVERWMQGSTKK